MTVEYIWHPDSICPECGRVRIKDARLDRWICSGSHYSTEDFAKAQQYLKAGGK